MASSKRPLGDPSSGGEDSVQPPRKRASTVYDAVAGLVYQRGFLPRGNAKPLTKALRPDEVLYRSRNAPTRYEEDDYYFAHRNLPPDQKLPESDLLSALHAYISEFYGTSQEVVSPKVFKSMDETALIAFGILMEEMAREELGETGDLVFLEAGEPEDEVGNIDNEMETTERGEISVSQGASSDEEEGEGSDENGDSASGSESSDSASGSLSEDSEE